MTISSVIPRTRFSFEFNSFLSVLSDLRLKVKWLETKLIRCMRPKLARMAMEVAIGYSSPKLPGFPWRSPLYFFSLPSEAIIH